MPLAGAALATMITVRPATIDDDPILIAFGRKFYDSLPYEDIPYSESSAARWLSMMRTQGVLLVATVGGKPVGMAGGLFSPCIWNDDYLVGAELFWWIEPAHRHAGAGRVLLEALEAAAYARGAVRWSMIAIEDGTVERVASLYQRAGYSAAERTFSKRPQPSPPSQQPQLLQQDLQRTAPTNSAAPLAAPSAATMPPAPSKPVSSI